MSITMYSTQWCGYCQRLKGQMDRAGIEYVEIDIEHSPEHVAIVEQANGGNRTVPTIVLPNGVTLTNPSIHQLQEALGS